MDTTIGTRTFSVQIPQSDWQIFDTLARERGWKTREHRTTTRKRGLELALEDVEAGRVHGAKDADDLFRQVLG